MLMFLAIARKYVSKWLSDEQLKSWATTVNQKVDIPILNEQMEQKIFEEVLLIVGKLIRAFLLQEKEDWWEI